MCSPLTRRPLSCQSLITIRQVRLFQIYECWPPDRATKRDVRLTAGARKQRSSAEEKLSLARSVRAVNSPARSVGSASLKTSATTSSSTNEEREGARNCLFVWREHFRLEKAWRASSSFDFSLSSLLPSALRRPLYSG